LSPLLLDFLGFTDEDLDKPANAFSGGQKTRINLAKALVRRPDFLFLDEPGELALLVSAAEQSNEAEVRL